MTRCTICLFIFASVIYCAESLQPVREYQAGNRYRTSQAPGPELDPVATPAVDSIGLKRGRLSRGAEKQVIADLVNRIEAMYAEQADADVLAWLADRPEIREAFWLAIDPHYDYPLQVVSMLGQLINAAPQNVEQFYHLAIAIAVVHDDPKAASNSQYFLIWGVEKQQFQPRPDPVAIFNYYTQPQMSKVAAVPLDKLVWPLLVHLADLDLNAHETQWVAGRYKNGRQNLAGTYTEVPYDNNKLEGKATSLGSRPYTMANILQYGGVCVDQAHYASRVMKSLGIPAVKVRGDGRYGGNGHAWTGYLSAGRRSAAFAFTGRYDYDYYYVGYVLDPQRSTMITDRSMAMDLSAALRDYHDFVQARALVRVARSLFHQHPEVGLALTEAALKINPLVQEAWLHVLDYFAIGKLDRKAVGKWMNTMMKEVKDHPDLIWQVCVKFLQHIPQEDRKIRDRMYKNVFAMLGKRPDLQVALRSQQCQELYHQDQLDVATNLAVNTLVEQADEGSLILPLLSVLIDDAIQRPASQRRRICSYLAKMEAKFPMKRGSKVSKAWQEMNALMVKIK